MSSSFRHRLTLTWEQALEELGGVHIGERMVPRVPPTVTRIETAHGGELVVDDTELLVVREIVHELAWAQSQIGQQVQPRSESMCACASAYLHCGLGASYTQCSRVDPQARAGSAISGNIPEQLRPAPPWCASTRAPWTP
jgi:hypothetical protein